MKRFLLFAFLCGISSGVAFTLVRPADAPPAAAVRPPLLEGAHPPPRVLSLLETSCQDCHSANTHWPFYSRIFPVSWLIQRDVREARSHLDMSAWQAVDEPGRRRLLAAIGAAVRGHVMPPARYLLLHPDARLGSADIDAIYQWTRAERGVSAPVSQLR